MDLRPGGGELTAEWWQVSCCLRVKWILAAITLLLLSETAFWSHRLHSSFCRTSAVQATHPFHTPQTQTLNKTGSSPSLPHLVLI